MLSTMSSTTMASGTSCMAVRQRARPSGCRMRAALPRGALRIQAFKEDDKVSDAATRTKANLQNIGGEADRNGKGVSPSYDQDAPRVFALPAFTRRREVFVGRMAMFGFAAAYIGEILTGQGIIGQVQGWTGWSEQGVVMALATLVGLNLIGGVWPNGPTFSEKNQQDIYKRPTGPVQEGMDPVSQPMRWLGISGWGFTKANELFHGRLAMLGFALVVIAELRRGHGVIGQIFEILDKPVNYTIATWGLIGWAVLATSIAYAVGKPGELRGGKDMF